MSTAASMQKLPLITLPVGQHQRGLGELVSAADALTKIRLPLAGVEIQAQVADRIATVKVHQKFVNDHAEAIECTYVFPLSGGCAVSDFEMRVGTRVVKGVVEERGQARANYQQALQEGKRAALLEQERDDVFTVQVGNIPPNEEVSVVLTYSEKLVFFEDGRTEIMLPLVVAPRYIPGEAEEGPGVGTGTESDTDIVPDASRITPPRLAPGFDPKVALNIEVDIATGEGLIVEDLTCSQHATKVGMSADSLKVGLSRSDELMDRDFVLSWRLSTNKITSNLITYTTENGDLYGMLSILPPASEVVLTIPRDVVFVLDRSGSMEGEKMVWAARSCANLISTLRPTDRFAIAAFDDTVEWYSPNKVRNGNGNFALADEAGIALGCDYLRTINARGGTEMYWALDQAFDELFKVHGKATEARIPIVILLTDGDVGDESRIFKLIQSRIAGARLFTLGVDSAVNTGLLRRVAQLGGGTATFVQPGAQIEGALRAVAREIGPPVLTDITIDDAGKIVVKDSVTPDNVPDVFAGRGASVFLKLNKKGTVKIKGTLPDGKTFEEKVSPVAVKVKAISQLWAKGRITDIEDQMRMQPNYLAQLRKDLIALSIEHSILTRFTAFVAIDHSEIANTTGKRLEVTQPVHEPAGWVDPADPTKSLARPGSSLMGQLTRQRGAAAPSPQQQTNCWSAPPAGGAGGGADWGTTTGSWGAAAPAPAPMPGSGFGGSAQGDEMDDMFSQCAEGSAPAHQEPPVPESAPTPAAPPPPAAPQPPLSPYRNFNMNFMAGAAPAEEEPQAKAKAEKSDKVAKLPTEVAEFFQALLDAWKEFQAGKSVNAGELEKKRQDALTLLASYPKADKVPQVQTFLRSQAVELINSLKAKGATPENIRPLWERYMAALEAAHGEATNFSKEKRFWEMFS